MWTRASKSADAIDAPLSNQPQAKALTARAGITFACVFAGVFTLVGGVASYFLIIRPMAAILDARSWSPVPCTILSSEVRSHRGSKSTTYSVDVFYEYTFNGQTYKSSRYKFMPGSSSGYDAKAQVVSRYPKGSSATCYVNPRRPSQAVLERGFTPDLWLGLIPLAFALGGFVGLVALLRRRGRKADTEPTSAADAIRRVHHTVAPGELRPGTSETRLLKSSSSRIGAAVGIGLFGAFWNGIIFFGFIRSSKFFSRGAGDLFDWFQFLFMIPFVLVGLVLIGLFVYTVLGLFNPKVTLKLSPATATLGGQIALDWELTGRIERLRGLEIYLESREEATYRRGTSTYTDKKPFLKLPVHSTTGSVLATGNGSVALPLRSMPTFDSGNNRIIWSVCVVGAIPRWPDLKEEFVIQVQAPSAINHRHDRPENTAS